MLYVEKLIDILKYFQFILLKSKHRPRIDTYWLLGKGCNDVATSTPAMDTTEENKDGIVPDYIKELIFPRDNPLELNVKELGNLN